ncbi:hypothetical protein SESBI_39547 [Sesbania bispinosa]|nr:hypothetical protein SESBI_39547 [Sesbania bispinosa]
MRSLPLLSRVTSSLHCAQFHHRPATTTASPPSAVQPSSFRTRQQPSSSPHDLPLPLASSATSKLAPPSRTA